MTLEDDKKDYLAAYEDAETHWQPFITEADNDLQVYLGDQLTGTELAELKAEGRCAYQFNKTRRIIDLIAGYEWRNQHVLKIGPVGGEDDLACSQLTGLIMNFMTTNRGYRILSDSFLWGILVSGSNLIEPFLDRSGDIQFSRLGHNEFLLDQNLTQEDLGDCLFILRGKVVTDQQTEFLLPNYDKEIQKIKTTGSIGRWSNLPKVTKVMGKETRLYEEFWHRETKTVKKVIDRVTAQEWLYDDLLEQLKVDKKRLDYFISKERQPNGLPWLSTFNDIIPSVKLTILLDGEIIDTVDNPTGLNDFNFIWMHGLWAKEAKEVRYKLQGIVRALRDVQAAKNRRHNQALDIIESQIQTGQKAISGSIVNPEVLESGGQGKTIWIKESAAQGLDSIAPIVATDVPAGLFNLLAILDKEEVEIPAMNEEIFGTDEKQIPGILYKMRTGAALTALSKHFANLGEGKRLIGKKLVRIIQKNYSDAKIKRIINEDPAPGLRDENFTKYDCTPTEGILTDTQREMWYAELKAMKQEFPDAPITFDMLFEASPMQLKHKFREMIAEAEKQRAAQQAEVAAQQKEMSQLQEAATTLTIAQAQERMTAAQENKADIALTRAKTMAEIQNLRTERLVNLLDRVIKLEEIKIQNLPK